MSEHDIAIQVEGLWKRYGLPLAPALHRISHRLTRRPYDPAREETWALRDISFTVERGKTLGIIGHNGAGKSTLLKVLAGVSPLTRGRVDVRGAIFPMIELNAGVNPELTGRENIDLLCTIMGLSRQATSARFDEMAEFSELGKWLDKPVWQYSSGMRARLGFSVAMNINAEILLVDEVLAVGDLAFRKKCYGHLEEVSRQGAAILFVSHSIRQVERLSDEVMLLDGGQVAEYGAPEAVCFTFNELMSKHAQRHTQDQLQRRNARLRTTGELRILGVEILDQDGQPCENFAPYETLRIRVNYEADKPLDSPFITLRILTSEMVRLATFHTEHDLDDPSFVLRGAGAFECVIPSLPFMPDCFTVGLNIRANNGRPILKGDHLADFCVEFTDKTFSTGGLVHVEGNWHFPDA